MSKRHSDAIAISQGAVNISGMAHSLVSACKECIEARIAQHNDPAVRLIVSQIAYIAGVWNGVDNWGRGSFSDDSRACNEAIVAEITNEREIASKIESDNNAAIAELNSRPASDLKKKEKPEKEELSCYSSDERRDANGKTL